MTTPTQAIGAEPELLDSIIKAVQSVYGGMSGHSNRGMWDGMRLRAHDRLREILEARATQPTMVYSPEPRKQRMLNDEALNAGADALRSWLPNVETETLQAVARRVYDAVDAELPNYVPGGSAAEQLEFIEISGMWALTTMPPVDGMDEIMKHYETTFGRYPDAFMGKVVAETKERLFKWWGAHRDVIRAALVVADAPAAQTQEAVAMVKPAFIMLLASFAFYIDPETDEEEECRAKWLDWARVHSAELDETITQEQCIEQAIAVFSPPVGEQNPGEQG